MLGDRKEYRKVHAGTPDSSLARLAEWFQIHSFRASFCDCPLCQQTQLDLLCPPWYKCPSLKSAACGIMVQGLVLPSPTCPSSSLCAAPGLLGCRMAFLRPPLYLISMSYRGRSSP